MDEHSVKRVVGGVFVPRKASGLVLRDTADTRDGSAQFCNRLGCSGRLNYAKSNQNRCLAKRELVKPCFSSSRGKEIVRSSSGTCSMDTQARKSFGKQLCSKLEADSSPSVRIRKDLEHPRINSGVKLEKRDGESSKGTPTEVGSSTGVGSIPRATKVYHQRSALQSQDAKFSSSYLASNSESTVHGACDSNNQSRHGFKSIRCDRISDVLPHGCAYPESKYGRRINIVKTRTDGGESSSYVRRKTSGRSSSDDVQVGVSAASIVISDATRLTRNSLSGTQHVASSVRTRRSVNLNARTGHMRQSDRISQPLVEPPVLRSSVETSSSGSSSNGNLDNDASSSDDMPVTSIDRGITRLINRNGLRQYNLNGIAEVLLALERIEQDEELTYEQLLSLETNFFLGGFNFPDQHRDMRLDIDNMSYEELLALEEEMGNVSTALSEDSLSKCLNISRYHLFHYNKGRNGCSGDADDAKCSICQEEYVTGEEIGWLGCQHRYHANCITQWLRLKNWCPICKATVAPSESSFL